MAKPQFREFFEPPNGFRFWRNGLSIKMRCYAHCELLTDQQLLDLGRASLNLVDQLRGVTPVETDVSQVLTAQKFVSRAQDSLYKRVSLTTWDDYLSKGHFRLGSCRHYRGTENNRIRDQLEGLVVATIDGACSDDHLCCVLESGNNTALFCGTKSSVFDETMQDRFGNVLVEIVDPDKFAQSVCDKISATNFSIGDVAYSDSKIFRLSHDFSPFSRMVSGMATDTPEAIHLLNEMLFETLYECSLRGGVYCKPHIFHPEMERWIVFEFEHDLQDELVEFIAPELAERHLRLVAV